MYILEIIKCTSISFKIVWDIFCLVFLYCVNLLITDTACVLFFNVSYSQKIDISSFVFAKTCDQWFVFVANLADIYLFVTFFLF